MKVTINFVNSRVKQYDAKDVKFYLDSNNTLCVDVVLSSGAINTFYASTIASINYDVKKPKLNVTSVMIW